MKKTILISILLLSITSFSQNYKFGKVSTEELQEKAHPLDPTTPAAILYSERTTTFEYSQDKGFYLVDEYFVRLKIYNQEGFDYATKTIPLFYSEAARQEEVKNLKGVTYNLESNEIVKTKLENSAVFLEKTNKYWNQKKFTMPNIKEGSVLEWEYRVESPFITKIDEYVFQQAIPIKLSNVMIKIPEYLVYNQKTKGYLTVPTKTSNQKRTMTYTYENLVTHTGEFSRDRGTNTVEFNETIYTIEMKNVSAMIDEPYSGNIHNFSSGLQMELSYTKFPNSTLETYASGWEAVTKKVYEYSDFGGQLKESNYFDDELQASLMGKTSESDRLNTVFSFVKDKIKYNGIGGFTADEGVKKAFKNGTGNVADINLNLVNMLRFAGFDANPVLVSTISNGIPIFPTINSYNYVVVSVNTTQGKVLLDASNKFNSINILPEKTLNFNGREVRKDGSSDWISLYPKEYSINKAVINVKLNENQLEGNSRVILNNLLALDYRNDMSGKTKEQLIEELDKKYDDIDVLDIRINNLDESFDKEVIENIKFTTENFVEEISGKTYITPLLFETQKKNPFKLDKREYPIYFNYPWAKSISITIVVPENYMVESIPESKEVALDNNLGGFNYKIINQNNLIKIESNIVINEPVISPLNYELIKTFFQDIVAKHSEKIVLTKN